MEVHMSQMLLIPDPRPLDRRLGRAFFRQAPQRPGVYVMKDAQDQILYVGKAKDLKQRLGHYRVANPDRMPRRHLRMVHEVSRIEFQFCSTESAALKHEQKLIRSLKPRFNRAGVWPGKPRFIVWRVAAGRLEISVVETPTTGWQRFGPLGGGAAQLHRSIVWLLWLALNPDRPLTALPAGWVRGEYMADAAISGGGPVVEAVAALEGFFWQEPEGFIQWLVAKSAHRTNLFERRVIELELENLREFEEKQKPEAICRQQLALL
jgi:predicted GIY-YIG superfamily endonuclease